MWTFLSAKEVITWNEQTLHSFLNKVSLNLAAYFQLILSEDTHKRTKNVHLYMQFWFIEKKMKNVS